MPVAVTRKSDDRVVVGVDPHKASWTAVAVDGSLRPLASVRVPVSRVGYPFASIAFTSLRAPCVC